MDSTAVATFAVAGVTGLLAVATFVLAFFAWRSIRENQHLITATQTSAKATEESAAAAQKSAKAAELTITEMRQDRELEYRPYLSLEVAGGWSSWVAKWTEKENPEIDNPGVVTVFNFGRGPAIHVLCCAAWLPTEPNGSPHLHTSNPFDLSPNDEKRQRVQDRKGLLPYEEIAGTPLTADRPAWFAFCQDQLGHYFRFVPLRKPDDWREGQGDRPPWVGFYLSHFEALSKV
jgi:hypothetical protein